MNTHFDVIVSGAGISGLLIASELSLTKKVLVIESKDELQTTKFWITLKSCVESNPELKPFINFYFQHMDFADAYQNQFRLGGDYVLWDTIGLMNFLKQKIKKNNGEIIFDQRFCGYKTSSHSIDIFANEGCYTAKLLVDCMGYNSPLVLAKDMISFKGYYLLYGAKLKLRQAMNPICLSNVMMDKKPKYFEAFPTSNGEVFTTIIYPTKSLTDMKALAGDFKYIATKSVYSKYFETEPILSRLWGIVPVGNIKRRSLDKIFFFGESAQSNPAASGTCLTRLLLNYKTVAAFLNDKIENNELTEKSLSQSPIVLNAFIRKLQLYAFKDILSWDSDKFSKFIGIINHVDHDLINRFLFGDLKINDIITLRNIKALIKPKNYFLTFPLIRSIK